MRTITGNLSYRKQYARKCILSGNTNTRSFDNCFEMGDGDEVVLYLIEKALSVTEKDKIFVETIRQKPYRVGSENYNKMRKIENNILLKKRIIEMKTWDSWLNFWEEKTKPNQQIQLI